MAEYLSAQKTLRLIHLSFLVPLLFLTMSCANNNAYLSGDFKAQILDRSGAPIVGAKVALQSVDNPTVTAAGVSDQRGFVAIPALRGRLPFSLMDRVTYAVARVEAGGYRDVQVSSGSDYFQSLNVVHEPSKLYLERE